MKNNTVLLVAVFSLGTLFAGCAFTPETKQGHSYSKEQVNIESQLNIYDKQGYYQGYIKSKPGRGYQIFDKEGYYLGEARSN